MIVVDRADADRNLYVQEVRPGGLLAEWNDLHSDRYIRSDDLISQVNDVSGEANLLYDALAKGGELTITLMRVQIPLVDIRHGYDLVLVLKACGNARWGKVALCRIPPQVLLTKATFAEAEKLVDAKMLLTRASQEVLADMDFFKVPSDRGDSEYVDKTRALAAVTKNWSTLEHVAAALRHDREVAEAALRQNGEALQYLVTDLQSNRDVVLLAVSSRGSSLRYASPELVRDRDFIAAAVKENNEAFPYAPEDVRRDSQVIASALACSQINYVQV